MKDNKFSHCTVPDTIERCESDILRNEIAARREEVADVAELKRMVAQYEGLAIENGRLRARVEEWERMYNSLMDDLAALAYEDKDRRARVSDGRVRLETGGSEGVEVGLRNR